MKSVFSLSVLLCLGSLTINASAAGSPAAGKKLATKCAACHGANGISTSQQFPILAGQYPDYLARVLHEYKSGVRNNAIMKTFAGQLSDQDIEDLAAYFANQPSPLHTPPRP